MSEKEYNSITYCTQRLRDVIDDCMSSRYGHKFANVENNGDWISFEYFNKKFAARVEIDKDCEKGEVSLDVKLENEWFEIASEEFTVERSKTQRISDKTYKPLFDSLILKGVGKYKPTKN